MSMAARRRQIFLGNNAKMHESGHKLNVRQYSTLRFDESNWLVRTVLVQNSHSRKIKEEKIHSQPFEWMETVANGLRGSLAKR